MSFGGAIHGFCQSRCELAPVGRHMATPAPHCGSGYKTTEKILTFIYPLSFSFFFFLLQPHFYTQVSEVPKAIKTLLKHTTPVLIEIVSVISMCIQITVVLYFRPILVLFGFFAVIAFFKDL